MSRRLRLAVRGGVSIACLLWLAPADARAESSAASRFYFESFCAGCHTVGRAEGSVLDLSRPEVVARSDAELMRTIRAGIPDRGMPRFELGLSDAEIAGIVGHLRELQGRAGDGSAPLPSEPLVPDPRLENGRRVFHGRARCGECHARDEIGGLQGPDLTGVGQRLSPAELREAILRPSASITPGYEAMVLVTKAGETIRGRTRKETGTSIQILDETGELWTTHRKQELRSLERDDRSLMPEGLAEPLSAVELEDLLHFLSR